MNKSPDDQNPLISQRLIMKLALFLLGAFIAPTLAKNMGAINVDGAGQMYVVGRDWVAGYVQVSGNELRLNGGGRVYFANQARDDFSGDMWWKVPLEGKHFSYTIDVSQVGCHCNSAAYFSQMGYNAGNDGEYYCDAFAGNGLYCPEYDTWEGNKHTMAVTLHTCDGGGGWWNSCDGGGCQSNAFYENGNLMCPEDRCTINTNRPFTVSHFQTSGSVNVWFEQDGRTASFDACKDGGYIGRFAPAFNDMVFVASLWGGGGIDMGWLDGMTGCGGDCNLGASSVAFSNFNIW